MASSLPPARSAFRTFIRHYSAPLDSSIPASKTKYIPTSGTYPRGFLVSGTHVGVKPANKSHPDLALIASDRPTTAAAVFTTNKFQAAPVQVSRSVLEKRGGKDLRGIVINSGCANAVTGQGGMDDAWAMSECASKQLGSSDHMGPNSLVMSTGVIGQRLPIQKILDKIPVAYANLSDDHSAWLSTAKAICTTDTFPKLLSTTFTLPGKQHEGVEYRLAGMTKGAGMIHPNMATLLGILCTDAPISADALNSLLKHAVNKSFNCISIDGDTSTNDTVAMLANGAASPSAIGTTTPSSSLVSDPSRPDYLALRDTLTTFSQSLSHLVVRDGEGATKFVTIRVRNAASETDARAIASSIARSPLVKTALYGKDANWGRILCAIGYTSPALLSSAASSINPTTTNVSFIPAETSRSKDEGVLRLLVDGEPQAVDEARASRLLEDEDLIVDVDLGVGEAEGTYWTCDFSHEYVTINGDYRT
jgi:glutamate N-acetyltransferase / amino-acid N-acetyltransferase